MVTFRLLSIYAFANLILLWMFYAWLKSCIKRQGLRLAVAAAYFVVYLAVSSLPVFGAMLPPGRVKYLATKLGNFWLGFYVYYHMIHIVLLVTGILVLGITRKSIWRIPKPAVYFVPTLAVLISLAINIYGYVHAHIPEPVYYDINLENGVTKISDLRVALIADLHMSVNSRPEAIRRMVNVLNKQNPDVILIAGDFFTSTYEGLEDPEAYRDILCGIRSRYGTFAVMGNHDVEEQLFGGFPLSSKSEAFRPEKMEDFVKSCGFVLLDDEIATIADGIQVAGRLDGEKTGNGSVPRKSPSELLSGADKSLPILVLQHEPVEFSELAESGADAVFCGHTHAGQFFPGNLIVPFFNENAYGLKVIDGMPTVVTAGVGYYGPPIRVATDSEVTVIDVHFSPER